MTTIRKFEDIEAWKKARDLAQGIYAATRESTFSKDFGLVDQVRRSSVSVMANIAEGFDRGGKKEFIQFLSVAKGSISEVKSHLYAAVDQGYLPKEKFDDLYKLADEIGRMIAGLMKYLSETPLKGLKYQTNEKL